MAEQSRLEQLGYDPHYVSAEQAAVIDGLAEEEMRLLLKIKQRMEETADVEGHVAEGGGVVW